MRGGGGTGMVVVHLRKSWIFFAFKILKAIFSCNDYVFMQLHAQAKSNINLTITGGENF